MKPVVIDTNLYEVFGEPEAGSSGSSHYLQGIGQHRDWCDDVGDQLNTLTSRQHQIMVLVMAGEPSKNIAVDLGISRRTVENHRAAIMRKTGSKSIPALARLAFMTEMNEPHISSVGIGRSFS